MSDRELLSYPTTNKPRRPRGKNQPMQAFVQVAKTPEHFGFNTQPMDREAAIKYADGVAKGGRTAQVFRAAPVTPGLTGRELLERQESFLTDDLIAEFRPATKAGDDFWRGAARALNTDQGVAMGERDEHHR